MFYDHPRFPCVFTIKISWNFEFILWKENDSKRSRRDECTVGNECQRFLKLGEPGWPSHMSLGLLILGPVMVSGSWDPQAGAECPWDFLSLSLPLPLPHCAHVHVHAHAHACARSLSQTNKIFIKDFQSQSTFLNQYTRHLIIPCLKSLDSNKNKVQFLFL